MKNKVITKAEYLFMEWLILHKQIDEKSYMELSDYDYCELRKEYLKWIKTAIKVTF